MKYYDTPIKSIRQKCLNCSYWQPKEVRLCPLIDCALYPYRMGTRPSDETLATIKAFHDKKDEIA